MDSAVKRKKSKDEEEIARKTTKQPSDEHKTSNRDTQIQMQSAEQKEICAEDTDVEDTNQHSQTTDRG